MVSPDFNKPIYGLSKALLLSAGRLMFRLRYEGTENIPRQGPLLITSNHQSHLDPPMVGMGVPRYIHFLAKRELAKSRFLAWFMQQAGVILVDRSQGREALESALAYLHAGDAVAIFPEGTRTRTGRLIRGRKGAALLAHRSGAQVLPACIIGANQCFPVNTRKIRTGRIRVRYGKPLDVEHLPEGAIPEEVLAQTTRRIMDAIEELVLPEMRPLPEEKATWYRDGSAI